jgi:hypothetical protein
LGEIEEIEGKHIEAAAHWRQAVDIAKKLGDKILHFKAEYQLYEQAKRAGNAHLSAAFERRLTKLSPWIPAYVEELQKFRTGFVHRIPRSRKRVSASQRSA